ncbi:hypothetical protein BST43_02205 [Mycobacteroides saopaulense]|uniref:Uncharacterized protein n=1 Tax=Mycobacteroides saopaulense TaxID=1578165 RepID=A0A1X0JBX2_9MYCO|nr:hypothetical protein [Mycobacteroides saopaulense]ORB60382.1 hypothetical protein BST43_02205 [Mycobacteroides saopaulense]
MCKTEPRRWTDLLQPRIMLPVAVAIAAAAVGPFVRSPMLLGVLAFVGLLALTLALFPAIKQVEFGLPSGLRITADLTRREEEMSQTFEVQKPIFEECASLLCDDPELARRLMETAIAQATLKWRGPVHPSIQTFTLCWFVHALIAHSRLTMTGQPSSGPNPLSRLTQVQRVATVLSAFAEVGIDDLADMLGLTPAQVQDELRAADGVLAPTAYSQGPGR